MILKNSVLSHRKHIASQVTRTSWIILFRKIITVYFERHTKQINALRAQNAEFFNVKVGGTYNKHCALKGYLPSPFHTILLHFEEEDLEQ
jgi:uracil DNA glycosylase